MNDTLDEDPTGRYGGSFIYSRMTPKGWRSLFGINVSGERKNAPVGRLDVWIHIKNLSEITDKDALGVTSAFESTDFHVVAKEKVDLIIGLANSDEANVFLCALRSLVVPLALPK